jgi:sec-independent protein translocase protein TatB
MFDLTSSKLLILGIIALLVVGPKDLPILLRTIGKYVGMIRKQANEFRAQFDEAMRESELDQIRKDVENVGREAEATMRDAEQSVQKEVDLANSQVDTVIQSGTPTPAVPTEAPKIEHATAAAHPVPALAPGTNGHVNGTHTATSEPLGNGPDGLPLSRGRPAPTPAAPEIKTGV